MKKIISLVMSLVILSSAAEAVEYYVNPSGSDSWSGKLKQANTQLTDGPFKTLERAKTEILNIKKQNKFTENVNVNIASGVYYPKQTLNFTLADSGMPGKAITWKGDAGSNVVISGGIPLTCSKKSTGIWECPFNQTIGTSTYFDPNRIRGNGPKFNLYVNNQGLQLARWPDKGWAYIKSPVTAKTQFSSLQALPTFSGTLQDAQIHTFPGNDWFDQILGVTSINQSTNEITLATPSTYNIAVGRRFFVQNILSAFDAPGEWFYDKAKRKISFISPIGMEPTSVVISSLTSVLTLNSANYLNFTNLSLQNSNNTGADILNSNNINLNKLTVKNHGGIGVNVYFGSSVKLANSTIEHVGSYGIKLEGGDRKTLAASGHIIYNNYVHDYAETLLTNRGIRVDGVGNWVQHNLVANGSGTGIELKGNNNLVEKNEVHHVCMQASDCGAIYSGLDWTYRGNSISNNYIHDILGYGLDKVDIANKKVTYSSPNGARGIYLDDAVSGFKIFGNILENAGGRSIQIGGGRDHYIHDNYIKTDQYAIWMDDRDTTFNWTVLSKNLDAMPYKSTLWVGMYPELALPMNNYKWPEGNRIENNIVVTNQKTAPTFHYELPVKSTIIANNLVWNSAGSDVKIEYTFLESQKNGLVPWTNWLTENIETGGLFEDPCATVANNKLVLCATSAANKISFDAIPADIGLLPQ